MTTLQNTTATKKVHFVKDGTSMTRAIYVQVYRGQEQVLDFKDYKSIKMAKKWGIKMLKN
jgi:hypothetical protein